MAKEYKITISAKNPSGGANQVQATDTGSNDNEKLDTSGAFAWAMAEKVAAAAANEIMTQAMYQMRRDLDLNDDYIGQRNLQIAQSMISQGGSILSSAFGGFISGLATGNPILAVAGAVIGATVGTVSQALETSRVMEQQDIRLRQIDAQLSYQRQRAGWSLNAASIGEDL